MGTTTKILAALVLGLALVAGLQTVRVHQLKAEAAEARERHATATAKALADQAARLGEQTIAERKAKEARERQVAALLREIQAMEDYHARAADSVRSYLNGMLERAGEPGGLVPATPARPSRTRAAQGGPGSAGG